VYRTAISYVGLATPLTGLDDPTGVVVDYVAVASDGTNFVAVGNVISTNVSTIVSFSSPSFTAISSNITTSANLQTVSWSPYFNTYLIGDGSTGQMYSYDIGSSSANPLVNTFGPYTAYSSQYGQIFSNSPVACSNTVISNTYVASFDGGVTYPNTLPSVYNPVANVYYYATSIAYAPSLNKFFTFINETTQPNPTLQYYVSNIISSTVTATVTPTQQFQASLPIEYVYLADEEVKYIQGAKIDYVITQLQLASTTVPANTTYVNGYKLYFINPVKELFFVIQDSNVLQTNDYWNYLNTTTGGQQLSNLQLQFNGEDMISPTIADAQYLGFVQFLQSHTRRPDMAIYNYSFSIDPENYLPTGQVNMSRIMNQNIWITLTPNPVVRDIRMYAIGYNILRVQNGIAGMLFIDNNTSIQG
jgi:hypothetical protein